MSLSPEWKPPFLTALATLLCIFFTIAAGRLKDIFLRRKKPRKGLARLRDGQEDFYARRVYGNVNDCFNRPIASSPGAWIDVMERKRTTLASERPPEWTVTGDTTKCLNLGSYNYLGFGCTDPYCTPKVQNVLSAWGASPCSPRAEAGTSVVHKELEDLIADYMGTEAALTFGMGYATNTNTIPVLVGPGCLILSDALNHASIVAGARFSGAKVKVFRHNNPAHLERVLRSSIADGQPRTHRPWKKILIIVEGIYSMEGDMPPLQAYVDVKKKYGAYLFLDEAHSIGALGRTGRGCCDELGVKLQDVDVLMGTFTKSFGACGGYIAGSKALIDYMKLHSPAHLYATAMPTAIVQQCISTLTIIMGKDGTNRGSQKLTQLRNNANYFRRNLTEMGLHVMGSYNSPVIPFMIYHMGKIGAFSRLCLERRVAVVVVGFPATPLWAERVRICISASHTRADLDYALDVISEVADVMLMKYGKVVHHLPPPELEEWEAEGQENGEGKVKAKAPATPSPASGSKKSRK